MALIGEQHSLALSVIAVSVEAIALVTASVILKKSKISNVKDLCYRITNCVTKEEVIKIVRDEIQPNQEALENIRDRLLHLGRMETKLDVANHLLEKIAKAQNLMPQEQSIQDLSP